jgi:hypothetical protein
MTKVKEKGLPTQPNKIDMHVTHSTILFFKLGSSCAGDVLEKFISMFK